jgi:hypothetical protein
MGPDLTTAIVVGAVVGLFFVALGHAQLVWLARRKRTRDAGPREGGSPARTLLTWAAALLAALAFLRAATTRALPERPAFLVGEDLVSVRARPGLVAAHATRSADVRRGETLVRFTGRDGEEARLTLRARRQQLSVQLAAERMRPLDFDAEILRRAEAARNTLRDHQRRVEQLVSERDAIQREATSQRLALEARRYALEGDDGDAARELEPLQASLETERNALVQLESLAERGLVARLEAERARDALGKLEGRVRQLQEKRARLSREHGDLASLRGVAEATLERQLADRVAEVTAERGEIATAQAALTAATAALDEDRPRAEGERRKRLQELEQQVADCDALLDGRGAQLAVVAPWDGRIGWRDPAPEAIPADGGPLLVAYRAGAIVATVRLEPAEAALARSGLEAEVALEEADALALPAAAREGRVRVLPANVVDRAALADGAVELRVTCDPPDRVVRRLAMGAAVPVTARLRRGLVHTPSFQLGVALALTALGLVLFAPLRSRLERRRGGGEGGGGAAASGGEPGWAAAGVAAWSPADAPALPPAAAAQSAAGDPGRGGHP